MKRLIITFLMTILLIGQAYFLGISDKISAILLLITITLLFMTLNRLQSKSKKTLRASSKKDSVLYKFLSKEPHLIIKIWVFLVSILFSCILVILLKGLVLQHGYFVPILLIILTSAILYTFINTDYNSKKVDENIQEDIASHGNEMIRIFFSAIVINFVLALALSAHDAHTFYTSEINIGNFTEYALDNQVLKREGNQYTRIPLNVYILAETTKMALAGEVVEHFKFIKHFYLFYFLSFIFNLFKLTIFALTLVLLQRSLDKRVDSIIPYVEKVRIWLKEKYFVIMSRKQEKKKIEFESESDEN